MATPTSRSDRARWRHRSLWSSNPAAGPARCGSAGRTRQGPAGRTRRGPAGAGPAGPRVVLELGYALSAGSAGVGSAAVEAAALGADVPAGPVMPAEDGPAATACSLPPPVTWVAERRLEITIAATM